MFTSSADVFRRRQAASDLISVVRAHRNAVSRLGATRAERAAISDIVDAGCVLTGPEQDRLASQLLLAAALPDDDFTAFIASTAILIINRLSAGRGEDDLFWNWDAFQDHYRLAEAPVRAALMNGYRVMDGIGLVSLDGGPSKEDCLTRRLPEVLAALRLADPFSLASAISADVSGAEAGRLWRSASAQAQSPATIAAFRFLYERPHSIQPESPANAPLIPWEDVTAMDKTPGTP